MAGKKKFEELLSRRIMGEQGWEFFCRLCGKYQPEQQFYKKKGGKLDPIREEDFKNTAELLCSLGYNFDNGISIHKQFCKKHNLPC